MKNVTLSTILAGAALTALSMGAAEAGSDTKKMAIVPTAKAAGFGTLTAAIEAAGLTEVLTNEGPFTVFAPTDEAFAKLPEGTIESLLKDPEALKNILLYHVVPGNVMASDVVKLTQADMANGGSVMIKTGDNVMVNDAKVVKTDIAATNGVIHVIDTVLLPPANDDRAASILDTARNAGFTTLLAAVEAAGLTDALSGEGPFTVFAPTDAAFAKLPKGALDTLLADPKALRSILLYHVVSGEVTSEQVVKLSAAATLGARRSRSTRRTVSRSTVRRS